MECHPTNFRCCIVLNMFCFVPFGKSAGPLQKLEVQHKAKARKSLFTETWQLWKLSLQVRWLTWFRYKFINYNFIKVLDTQTASRSNCRTRPQTALPDFQTASLEEPKLQRHSTPTAATKSGASGIAERAPVPPSRFCTCQATWCQLLFQTEAYLFVTAKKYCRRKGSIP